MTPEMEELNKRRMERQLLRQQRNLKKRRKKTAVAICTAVMVAIGFLSMYFLLRYRKEPEQAQQPTGTLPAAAQEADATVIHLVAAGDVNITDAVVASGGAGYDYSETFLDIAHLLAEGDITVLNFEGSLCGSPYGSNSRSAPQSLAEILSQSGVDLVQLANSYSINHGISGLQATIDSIRAAGMEPLGVYADERAYKAGKGYVIREVQGVKIAFVAFTKGMDGMTLPQGSEHCVNLLYSDYDSTYQNINREGIRQILDAVNAEKPDLTVAMLHWGSEYNDTIRKNQESIVELLQSLGVDAVIGTHPHYVQKMTLDPETGLFVAYSLGDLISDGTRSGTEYSVILKLEIAKTDKQTKITGYSYTPVFTVAEKGNPLRCVRIAEAITAYEGNHINRISESTYDAMFYALTRIEARVKGE